MVRTKLCDLLGIQYPIIQAGMGPFGTNKLCIASANAGVLGLISSSGVTVKEVMPNIFNYFVEAGGANQDDDMPTIMKKILRRTAKAITHPQGVFGVNIMVSAEMADSAEVIIQSMIEVRDESPDIKKKLNVAVTSAGDPMPWREKIKGSGMKWAHVVPSVKGAKRCEKAGVDLVIASGHEGGFHTSWEPVHSMILIPAAVEALPNTPVVAAGGFCDGKTLAAALALGAVGAQMGTRFLATKESDFLDLWKSAVVKTPDRGTLVARGFVGPARFIRTPFSEKHAEDSLKGSPGVYLGKPDDMSTIPSELLIQEINAMEAVYAGNEAKSLFAAGECAQRIEDMPWVNDMVQKIIRDAAAVLKEIPKNLA